jgi:hypothetical protein
MFKSLVSYEFNCFHNIMTSNIDKHSEDVISIGESPRVNLSRIKGFFLNL